MEHKGDHGFPFETTSCGIQLQCPFQWHVDHMRCLSLQRRAVSGSPVGMGRHKEQVKTVNSDSSQECPDHWVSERLVKC